MPLSCGCGSRTDYQRRQLPKTIPHEYLREIELKTKLAHEEISSLYFRFRQLAPMGEMTFSMFRSTMGMLGMLDDLFLSHRMFCAFDANEDGRLNFVEFAISLGIMIRGNDDEKLELAFKILSPSRSYGRQQHSPNICQESNNDTSAEKKDDPYTVNNSLNKKDCHTSGSMDGISLFEFRNVVVSLESTRRQLIGGNCDYIDDWQIERLFRQLASRREDGTPIMTLVDFKHAVRTSPEFLCLLGVTPGVQDRQHLSVTARSVYESRTVHDKNFEYPVLPPFQCLNQSQDRIENELYDNKTSKLGTSDEILDPTSIFQRPTTSQSDTQHAASATDNAGGSDSSVGTHIINPDMMKLNDTLNELLPVTKHASSNSLYLPNLHSDSFETDPQHKNTLDYDINHLPRPTLMEPTDLRSLKNALIDVFASIYTKSYVPNPSSKLSFEDHNMKQSIREQQLDSIDDDPPASRNVLSFKHLPEQRKNELLPLRTTSLTHLKSQAGPNHIISITGFQDIGQTLFTAGGNPTTQRKIETESVPQTSEKNSVSDERKILHLKTDLSLPKNVSTPSNSFPVSKSPLQLTNNPSDSLELNQASSILSDNVHITTVVEEKLARILNWIDDAIQACENRSGTTSGNHSVSLPPTNPRQSNDIKLRHAIQASEHPQLISLESRRSNISMTPGPGGGSIIDLNAGLMDSDIPRMYMNRPNFAQRAKKRHGSIAQLHQRIQRRRPEYKLLGPSKGFAVHFGHPSWNMVLNMMVGIRLAGGRINNEPRRKVEAYDFIMKEKISILPHSEQSSSFSHKVNMEAVRFIDYAPMVFRKIRECFGVSSQDYLQSIGPEQLVGNMVLGNLASLSELCSEGKSGAFFYYTADGRFLIKTITRDAAKFFRKILKPYYEHIVCCSDTLMTRFYGYHAIRLKKDSGNVGAKLYFVIMSNFFHTPVEMHRRYDLKGSWIGRTSGPGALADPTIALKDKDMINNNEKICIGPERKRILTKVIKDDADFFKTHLILDYSLLVGIHIKSETVSEGFNKQSSTGGPSRMFSQADISGQQLPSGASVYNFGRKPFHQRDLGGMISSDGTRVYYLGIIDILTRWTALKRFEHDIKAIGVKDSEGISCIHPTIYAKRFASFLEDRIE